VCHAAPIAVVFRDADPEYDGIAGAPLQERTDTLQEAAGLRVSFETGWRTLCPILAVSFRIGIPVSRERT
jgi:hypothetical protein